MTKDEMKNRISMALKDHILQQGFECICKENANLEEKISILLSCKNCPVNKGGYICQKEYEDKCLAQKIQYIKELKEKRKAYMKEYRETHREYFKAKAHEYYRKKCGLPPLKIKI
jgi:hypothetical protein